jgi:hypothetical protein
MGGVSNDHWTAITDKNMPLPKLKHSNTTLSGLRQATRLLAALQRLTQPPQPAFLELALQVWPRGFVSGRLPSGGQVWLDLKAAALVYAAPDGSEMAFPLDGCSQAQVFADLFGALAQTELAGVFPPGKDLFESLMQGIAASGRYRAPQADDLLDRSILQVDAGISADFLLATREIFTGMAAFLAHLPGLRSSLVFWPVGFDLSTLLFPGGEIDEEQPHLNFGFAPLSDEDDPAYLYAYAYPYPEQYDPPALPEGAIWHTHGWTGAMLPYERITVQSNPRDYVEKVCMSIYDSLYPLLAPPTKG